MVKKTIYSLMLLGIILMNCSCRNDENSEPTFEFNKPCLEWGTNIQSVKEYMNVLNDIKKHHPNFSISEVKQKRQSAIILQKVSLVLLLLS